MVAAVSFQMLVREEDWDVLLEALDCYSEMMGGEFPRKAQLAIQLEVRLSQIDPFPKTA